MLAKIKAFKSQLPADEYDRQLESITGQLTTLRRKCEHLLRQQGVDDEEIARILVDYRNYEKLDHRDLTIKKIMTAYRNRVLPLHDDWAKLLKECPYRKKIEVFDAYDLRLQLKKRGYTYCGENRSWYLVTYSPDEFNREMEFLQAAKVEIKA